MRSGAGVAANRSAMNSELRIRVHDVLTSDIAPGLCRAARDAGAGPGHVWLDLEDVKVTDVVGLAATLQTCRFLQASGVRVSVMPSAAVYRAVLSAAILEDLPLEQRGVEPPEGTSTIELRSAPEPTSVASTSRLQITRPAWGEMELIAEWAKEPLLEQMVGSSLLQLCRHLGPYHPDVATCALHDPTAFTMLVHPRDSITPAGFVRLYGVNLGEGFGFLETALVDRRALRAGLGVEASRLVVAWAMDALGLRRVEAKVYAYNLLSVNSLRRNGFTQEGVLRQARTWDGQRWDILVFGMLEDEMRRQRAREGFPYMGFWPRDDDP
jgi:hypothetical protein